MVPAHKLWSIFMYSLNKVTLIGNVGDVPEIRTTQNGDNVASFSLATSEKWKDKTTGEDKQVTEWHKIVIFNPNLVNIAKQYIAKGTKLYIEGSLKTRKYESKLGVSINVTEIVLGKHNGHLGILTPKEQNQEATTPLYKIYNISE